MARKIIMKGDEAQYIERRGTNAVKDDREILMEGKHARYEEHFGSQPAHFPMNGSETVGRQWFDFLMMNGFIARDTEIGCWQYMMGFTTEEPSEVRPIEWLKTVETARMMLVKVNAELLESNVITKGRIKELAAQCFTKKGKPLELAKPKTENSSDANAIDNFFPTFSDL